MSFHIAFFSIPAYGHVTPTLAVVKELVRRGHQVTYVTTEEFAETVAGAGACVSCYESTWSSPTTLPNPITADDAARMRLLLLDESIAQVPTAKSQFANDLPDLLVYDTAVSPAARVLARKWDKPAAQLFTGMAFNEHFSLADELAQRYEQLVIGPDHPALVKFRAQLVDFLAVYEMTDVPPEEFIAKAEGLSLVFQPKVFQPACETFDERYAFVGPCLGDRGFQGQWWPPEDGSPVLLVSLGTLYNHWPEFFRACVQAFVGLPWHVVMSIGHRVELAEIGPLPSNFEAHQHVPQLAVLRHAQAFVSHAGMGSTMESLYFGTPLVVVPHTPEQDVVGRRVVELGLGRRISCYEVTAKGLREAVLELASDEVTRDRVLQMQRHIRDAGGATRAADEIEAYLRRTS